ncbi:MAG: ribonuclease HII [Oscillospiraceae bacterium]|nr:ribonuclease HII [Eubacteriales bacterium]MDY2617827.1 ribonuclease HII [Oscillospiraceae bacterium]
MTNAEYLTLEHEAQAQGYAVVCGADEAGAGPLAGPVYAAAVSLPDDFDLPWLNDSKKVTPKRREVLFDQIKEQAVAWAVASVGEREIDEINILNARMKAMDQAIHQLNPAPDFALIDGNRNKGITIPNRMVVHGDSLSASISAASILAKVSRDRYMLEMAERYPEYHFEQHKGYGTKLHYEMLHKYGPCPIHRLTFLKKL